MGLVLAVAALACVGCDSGPTTADEQNVTEAKTATIDFDADFGETVDGDLVDGGTAILSYDDERVAKCRAQQGGIPQYAVTAFFRIDGGDIDSVVVAGLNAAKEPKIELDGSGELEIWFEVTNRFGCHEWDSDFGNNYRFDVAED